MKKATMSFAALAVMPLIAGAAMPKPDLGENVRVFSPEDGLENIHRVTEDVFKRQHKRQFGPERYAFLFLPGDYTKAGTLNVGYYTQVLGLGRTPDKVKLANVKTPAALDKNNATCNFWVGIENVSIADTDNNADPYFNFQWAVSQAAPARRLHVFRKSVFDWYYGWASGGFVADCVFEKPAGSYSQQQYFYRNSIFGGGIYGINWNQVIVGCEGATGGDAKDNTGTALSRCEPIAGEGARSNWRFGGCTTMVDATPVAREKPFLFFEDGAFKVFVPAIRRGAKGVSWGEGRANGGMGEGKILDLARDFHVAKEGKDTAKTINAALAAGKNVLFTPGIYRVAEPIKVAKPGTIVLGIGEATIVPESGDAALKCADADGIVIAGLIFDAERASKRFVVVGGKKSERRHVDDPIFLVDLVYRVGGTGKPGKTDVCLEVNANDVVVDHTWIWRADHGDHTGWTANTSKNGIVVNGDGVSCYGLFVEHFQEHDVLWNGEDGKVFFLQNEKCYDPPGNATWMSHGGKKKGYAAYKVSDGVKRHYAVGLGVYDVFINTNGNSVFLDDAVEVPDSPGVVIENACTVEIANGDGPLVGINAIVNGQGHAIKTGKGSGGGYAIQRVYRYSDGKADVAPNYYKKRR
ncbi:MAG: hypothetical protein IJG18_07315 [Kiritimatiellae bacterium]|nr:hypothetical protein [Kiritimatiellia bacterium]